jgi:hypothetical protein
MASIKRKPRVHRLPRVTRGEKDALAYMAIYTSVCPRSTSAARSFESLVRKGYAKRCRITLATTAARKIVRGKVAHCYKLTPLGLRVLRLTYTR